MKSKSFTKNKLTFITPSLANGGAERVMSILCNEFAFRGIPVTVLLTTDTESVYQLNESIRVLPVYGSSKTKLHLLQKIRNMRRYMKENREDTYVVFIPYDQVYTYLAAAGLGIRAVLSLRNDPSSYKGKMYDFIYKRVYPWASAIVFQTEDAQKYFPESIRRKSVIISNPLGGNLPEIFRGQRRKEFSAVGRMQPQKNYPMLLKAFSNVHKKHGDWKLVIYGSGPEEAELKALCDKLGIRDAVEFAGFVSNVPDRIRETGAFVMSSDFEGISNAMLEALAMGIPSICTDCPVGGARMYIRDGENGFLVPVKDADQMAEKMLTLIEEPDRSRRFTEELAGFKEQLSVKKIADQWNRILWK